jgi:hypothetical protein
MLAAAEFVLSSVDGVPGHTLHVNMQLTLVSLELSSIIMQKK